MTNAPPEVVLGPALSFLRRLWQLSHTLERLSATMEQRLGVTAQQRLMLRCLGKAPGMTSGQLATLLHVDPGTVSAALKRLEGKGLLRRRRDRRDGRRVTVELSAKGRGLDRPAQGTVEDAVQQLLETTPAADVEVMLEVVARLTTLIDALVEPRAGRGGRGRLTRPATTALAAARGRRRRASGPPSGRR